MASSISAQNPTAVHIANLSSHRENPTFQSVRDAISAAQRHINREKAKYGGICCFFQRMCNPHYADLITAKEGLSQAKDILSTIDRGNHTASAEAIGKTNQIAAIDLAVWALRQV